MAQRKINEMTISNDELSKLIELSDKANWKWGANTTIYTNPFIDAANPTTVKALCEELLLTRHTNQVQANEIIRLREFECRVRGLA